MPYKTTMETVVNILIPASCPQPVHQPGGGPPDLCDSRVLSLLLLQRGVPQRRHDEGHLRVHHLPHLLDRLCRGPHTVHLRPCHGQKDESYQSAPTTCQYQ